MGIAPDELVARACERSGLSDFGPAEPGSAETGSGSWQAGLAQLVDAAAVDLGHDGEAVARVEEQIVTRLVNRLGVEQWYAEHGDEARHPVQGPVVIVGLPRTATTALQFLLAQDPRFRFTRPWEVNAPVPPPDITTEAEDPRRLSAVSQSSVRHIASADGPIEDNPLWGLHFHSQELAIPVPTYTTWWRDADVESTFAYHERALRLLHARRPPTRWLIKGPAYLFHLVPFARQYPDARFLFTHRDPSAALPSTCSTVIDAWSMVVPTVTVEPTVVGRYMLEHYVDGMRRAMDARPEVGEHRFLDIAQADVEQDVAGTAARIYAFLDLELTDDVRTAITAFADANQRGARGVHEYTAEQYGYTTDGIRDAFADYLERFGDYTTSE